MNDLHVKALHYWVNHDESVNYNEADPIECEYELFHLKAEGRRITIQPKGHYTTEEEAITAVEGFIRQWEFEAALTSGRSRFSLSYMSADVIDRTPPPPPQPGTLNIGAIFAGAPSQVSARVTVVKEAFPQLPSGEVLNLDTPVVQTMLAQLDMYHERRALLSPMAYFCLTALEYSVPEDKERNSADQRTREYYGISLKVLRKVRNLSSSKGGSEARKGYAVSEDFNKEERIFLLAAVQAFIRRAAERATCPDIVFPTITLADLPPIHD